jgi:hypothetical protein
LTQPGGQHQERRLEGVLGVVVVAQDGAANVEHHRAVPSHHGLERRLGGLAAAREELRQKLGVGEVSGHPEVRESLKSAEEHNPRSSPLHHSSLH